MTVHKQNEHVCLKVFSGPHLGAEIVLEDGEYLIGSGEDCDILLRDGMVAPKHMRLFIQADKPLRLLPIEKSVYVEGKKIDKVETPVELYQAVTIGTTLFSLGLEGEPWPDIKSLSVAEASVPVVVEMEAPAIAGPGELPSEGGAAEGEEGAPSVQPPLIEEVTQPSVSPAKKWIRVGVYTTLAALVLLVLGGMVYFKDLILKPAGPEVVEAPPPTTAELVQALFQRMQIANSVELVTKDNRETIQGYVDTSQQLFQLQREARQIDPRIKVDVWANDALLAAARDVVRGKGVRYDVQLVGNGEILVRGCSPDVNQARDVEERLRQDVPGLRKIETNIRSEYEVLQEVVAFARQAGLETVSFDLRNDILMASGGITTEKYPVWKNLRGELGRRYEGFLLVQDRVNTARAATPVAGTPEKKVDFSVKLVNIGDTKWVVLDDNIKYFEGARLPNGATLLSIASDGIVVDSGRGRTVYKIGGG